MGGQWPWWRCYRSFVDFDSRPVWGLSSLLALSGLRSSLPVLYCIAVKRLHWRRALEVLCFYRIGFRSLELKSSSLVCRLWWSQEWRFSELPILQQLPWVVRSSDFSSVAITRPQHIISYQKMATLIHFPWGISDAIRNMPADREVRSQRNQRPRLGDRYRKRSRSLCVKARRLFFILTFFWLFFAVFLTAFHHFLGRQGLRWDGSPWCVFRHWPTLLFSASQEPAKWGKPCRGSRWNWARCEAPDAGVAVDWALEPVSPRVRDFSWKSNLV